MITLALRVGRPCRSRAARRFRGELVPWLNFNDRARLQFLDEALEFALEDLIADFVANLRLDGFIERDLTGVLALHETKQVNACCDFNERADLAVLHFEEILFKLGGLDLAFAAAEASAAASLAVAIIVLGERGQIAGRGKPFEKALAEPPG